MWKDHLRNSACLEILKRSIRRQTFPRRNCEKITREIVHVWRYWKEASEDKQFLEKNHLRNSACLDILKRSQRRQTFPRRHYEKITWEIVHVWRYWKEVSEDKHFLEITTKARLSWSAKYPQYSWKGTSVHSRKWKKNDSCHRLSCTARRSTGVWAFLCDIVKRFWQHKMLFTWLWTLREELYLERQWCICWLTECIEWCSVKLCVKFSH